ncbi:MAG: caspase domain-containing protein [Methylococcales bacterium]
MVALISDKDHTRFTVDGKSIGNEVQAGGELKILINSQSHDIIAQPKGYQAKPQHIQPPFDEHSPISFGFTYKDKQSSNNVMLATVVSPSTNVTTPQAPTHSEEQHKPIETQTSIDSPVEVTPPVLTNNKFEQRVALVIGNSAYQFTGALPNPVNDARDIAQVLEKLKFKVILKTDASLEVMADAIYQFGENLKGGGVGLFYYSGHGLQVKGENYLLPVDANLMREDDIKRKAINANDVMEKMGEGKSHLNLVFMDACRNNPFPSSTRAVSRGLIGMNAPNGTLVVFSTNPGNVAADGSGRNGTYTKHLLEQMSQPKLEIGMMLRKVRTAVKEDTGGQQVPWENGSIEGEFFFNENSP